MTKIIKIKDESKFTKLLNDGYKIVNKYGRFSLSRNGDRLDKVDYSFGYFFLEKDDEKITVDCSDLGFLFTSKYEQVANIEHNYFDIIPNQRLKCDIEGYTYDYFSDHHKPCLNFEKITDSEQIIRHLKAFVENEITSYTANNEGKNLFNIFANIIIIFKNENKIDFQIYKKDELEISKIEEFRKNAKNYEYFYGFSFFYLFCKSEKSHFDSDAFIGEILYDFKNRKTISFALTSYFEDINKTKHVNPSSQIIASCKKIFQESIAKDLSLLSLMHISILHPLYTPIPWFYFAVHYPFQYAANSQLEYFITIPEFFLLGISKDINTQNSLYYQNIKQNQRGSAVVIFDLIKSRKIGYSLRFDVSKGEQFIHLDFGLYGNKGMQKIISHFPIDMELLKKFNHRIFVSIISSGFYDPEFAKILKNRIKNIAETIQKYKELSEPLKVIHNIESKAKWLEDNQLFDEYEKIFRNDKDIDLQKYYKISNEYYGLFGKDETGKIRLSHEGMMILARKFKGDNSKIYFIENFLYQR